MGGMSQRGGASLNAVKSEAQGITEMVRVLFLCFLCVAYYFGKVIEGTVCFYYCVVLICLSPTHN